MWNTYPKSNWWNHMMFDYIYADGSSISLDYIFEKELIMIAEYFEEAGFRYCNECEAFIPKFGMHGCDL